MSTQKQDKPVRAADDELNAVGRSRAARADLVNSRVRQALTADQENYVIEMLAMGATVGEIAAIRNNPSIPDILDHIRKDAPFSHRARQARAEGAAVMLEDAADMLNRAAETGRDDHIKAAAMYHNAVIAHVAKVAPREFGPLLKIAGDAEQDKLSVSIVRFGTNETGKVV
jgi:uncharacterized membrane protein